MRWILAGTLTGLAAFLVGLAMFLTIERRPADPLKDYPRDTPGAVIESLFRALEAGEARLIPRFVHAETEEQRLVLAELSRLFGSLQTLATTIQERFPQDVARIRAQAAGGRGFTGVLRAAGESAGRSGAPQRTDPRFNATVGTFLADPLGWLRDAKGRIAAAPIAEDMAAITIDGRPAFGVGMTMRREGDEWFIELPLKAPGVSRFAPRTVEEHQVLASMIRVIDNTIVDLDRDLRNGQAQTLDDAAALAGRKSFGPIALVFIAYQRVVEARNAQ